MRWEHDMRHITADPEAIVSQIERFKSSPAVLSWYISDEVCTPPQTSPIYDRFRWFSLPFMNQWQKTSFPIDCPLKIGDSPTALGIMQGRLWGSHLRPCGLRTYSGESICHPNPSVYPYVWVHF